ncbi:MAG: glucosidase [Chloroflexi bacterium]|nr:glucosidase [Chloroflexota bacterium]MCL5273244.1 glucosidase [Chloroflexota bacterium]
MEKQTKEHERLQSHTAWRKWGPYLSERAWGTVREDYSPNGAAWDYFPHDHARSRAYRWNEDGLGGVCDDQQRLCLALALWNGHDPILKERLFGLSGPEGNHGEDVKECYYYLDNTPTHSYMKMLYKYPHAAYPYENLVVENRRRGKTMPEYELLDTGVFDEDRYFDVFIEYAKEAHDGILMRISAINRGPEAHTLHLLPTLWFRNTWSWGRDDRRPEMHNATVAASGGGQSHSIAARHPTLGNYILDCPDADELLFTENETNVQGLFGAPNGSPYVKDAFHEAVVRGNAAAVNPERRGTKAAAHYVKSVASGETWTIHLRLAKEHEQPVGKSDDVFAQRLREADEFYASVQPAGLTPELKLIQRQAFAGMLWSKQFYHYDVSEWLEGDPAQPPPPPQRERGRNCEWNHLNTSDVISMPDTWEYPWFAAWDLAFHCITLALLDCQFAKDQLVMILREWFQHPNGQVPAYEWAFGDVNPPVMAWAAWRIYKIEQRERGCNDTAFLERVFHKMMLFFTWWVNRKDTEGRNVFQGGFLGLDNIGVFDRSAPLPTGGHIEQSDGTSWMAMFSLNMMTIALELARTNPVYEDIATKFFEHFMYIAGAMNDMGREGISLWDEQDQFFYDVLHTPDGNAMPMRVHSVVGLIPLLAVETVEPDSLKMFPAFKTHLEWFLEHRPQLASLVSHWHIPGAGERRQLALVRGHRFKRLLKRALDPAEFLSDHGIRSVSKYHETNPYTLRVGDATYVVPYEPAESHSGLFGGNSNWRGPVWFPINYLLIEALQKFHHYYGDDFKIECPTGSGQYMTIDNVANDLAQRLIGLFTRNDAQRRPFNGDNARLQTDPNWHDHILFYEYFNGDNGAGAGASHQTGWTGLVAELIQQLGEQLQDKSQPT